MKLTEVIRRPLITEKTTDPPRRRPDAGVRSGARAPTRSTSSAPSRQLLGSKVASVRTAIAHGKIKRQGRFVGRRSDWKKAYVTLRDGREAARVPAGRVSEASGSETHAHSQVQADLAGTRGSRPSRPSTRSRPTSRTSR